MISDDNFKVESRITPFPNNPYLELLIYLFQQLKAK